MQTYAVFWSETLIPGAWPPDQLAASSQVVPSPPPVHALTVMPVSPQ
jgi:hypothetical protein